MILADGWLRPGPSGLVWLTDLDQPDRQALGLTSFILDCDRTEHRFVLPGDSGERWVDWCRRVRLPRARRDLLEMADGAQPLRWWVSERPIPLAGDRP